jgi:hypothetical protein
MRRLTPFFKGDARLLSLGIFLAPSSRIEEAIYHSFADIVNAGPHLAPLILGILFPEESPACDPGTS